MILQDFTIATKWHDYCTAQTHETIRIERQASDISCSICKAGTTCDSRQMYESNWTIHSPVTGIPKKIYETRTDEWHTAWIISRVPSLGVDTERDLPSDFFISSNIQSQQKKDPVI